jgi:hypothetical protein
VDRTHQQAGARTLGVKPMRRNLASHLPCCLGLCRASAMVGVGKSSSRAAVETAGR